MKPGDTIFVKRGQHGILGHGVVQSKYRFDPGRTTHKHLRDVRWDSNYGPGGRRVERNLVTKALTDITEDVDQVSELKIAVGLTGSPPPGERGTDSTPTEVDDSAASDRHPLNPFNQILYGPPGTGKTYGTVGHALAAVDGAEVREVTEDDKKRYRKLKADGRVAMVTFHQNYAYEDFVEGIRPRLTEPGERDADAEAAEAAEASASPDLAYELKHGVFRRICAAAEGERRAARTEGREPERFVLIIDEINRGNIPKIFGELITLIEGSRRLGESDETRVTLPYSGDEFGVPNNLYVIGTMNTADRSIQQLDTALRRRFTFVEMMPNPDHELIPGDVGGVDCRKMLRAMNERIVLLLDREHQIGHTYLFKVKSIEDLADRFQNRIFPLLQEYFYDDWRRIDAVLGGNAFVQPTRIGEGHARDLARQFDLVDEEMVIYERLPEDDPAWQDAGQYRKIYESVAAD
ncbi:MAG: AAA family ATPase [Acidobacteria bacterium]|nr:AAA family ATPase [Acidobacteriota bacterium]